MKNTINIIITLLISAFISQAKSQNVEKKTYYSHYIELDSLQNVYGNNTIHKYTLNTKGLYGFNKSVEVYNVLYKDAVLLISALPDLKGNNDWIKIDRNSIKKNILTKSQIKNIILERYVNNTSDKKTLLYGLIKKIKGEYYVPKVTLIEYFYIKSYRFPFIPSYGTIDINGPVLTIKEMEKSYKEQISDWEIPLNPKYGDITFAFPVYARNYLSKSFSIKGQKAYQFWTFDNWRVADYYSTYRGIDRFVYIPEKGIVGGSYDFYFTFIPRESSPISSDKFWDNIINEKVMIAEELK